jgi:hypothetical protein
MMSFYLTIAAFKRIINSYIFLINEKLYLVTKDKGFMFSIVPLGNLD